MLNLKDRLLSFSFVKTDLIGCFVLISLFPLSVGDFDKIWREHCEDEQTLSEYALAMKNLADNHWAKNSEGEGRIEWCRRYDCVFKYISLPSYLL